MTEWEEGVLDMLDISNGHFNNGLQQYALPVK